ncbi:hypothetical protein BJ138DRAFT_1163884 [Hygrophoropsis aurantiaca]|uniref:Uncharacterized protein n=1 Tax=Hygrophoropsis aurantiaca TaxID=72124 RepID=A0ACB7ZXR7_9AGAM|nr:hypothetical protein BJ138DRAFT_1163884 [Hygrophoropsis aurantiaca]
MAKVLQMVVPTTRKAAGIDPLQTAIAATAFTKDLVSNLQFPPATIAVSVLLDILETIQSIRTNRAGCDRLARRAAKIMCDIDENMRGRWENAPETLISNLYMLESILMSISDFIGKLADLKWIDGLLRKNSIEDALGKFGTMLDEAAQSFQMATLIDIHYAIRPRQLMSGRHSKPRASRTRSSSRAPAPAPAPRRAPGQVRVRIGICVSWGSC